MLTRKLKNFELMSPRLSEHNFLIREMMKICVFPNISLFVVGSDGNPKTESVLITEYYQFLQEISSVKKKTTNKKVVSKRSNSNRSRDSDLSDIGPLKKKKTSPPKEENSLKEVLQKWKGGESKVATASKSKTQRFS